MNIGAIASELRLGLVELNWTFFFQIANTLILFLFLKKFLFVPVTNFMEARESEVADSLDNAKNKNQEADQLKEEYLQKIGKSEEEGRQIVLEATKKAEKRADNIVKEAEGEISILKDKAQKDIEREHAKAVVTLKDDIATMAMLAASKVIEKEMGEDSHKALISEFIDEVGDTKWHN